MKINSKTSAFSSFRVVWGLLILLLVSCQSDDYVSAVPADADMVVSIDVQQLAKDADLANSGIVKKVDGLLALVVSSKDREKVNEYVDDPAKMGIDFRSPVYVFSRISQNAGGAVMKVLNQSDLEAFLTTLSEQGLCTKPVKKDGKMTGKVMDEAVYAFDGDALMLMVAKAGEAANQAKELLGQSRDMSFASTVAFDKMESGKGVVKAYLSKSQLMRYVLHIDDGMPNVDVVASIGFDKGKAAMKLSVVGDDLKAIDDAYKNLKRLDGEFDDDMPESFAVWASVGANGEWLLGKIKENKTLKEYLFMLERAIDIEQMLRAVDGDITYVASPNAGDLTENIFEKRLLSAWTVMAEIKNSDFTSDVTYWMESMREYGITMQGVGHGQYVIDTGEEQLHWGVVDDGKELYFASPEGFASRRYSNDNHMLDAYEDDIERSYFYAYINMESPIFSGYLNMPRNEMSKHAEKMKCIVVKSQNVGEVDIEVEMKDKNTNFLKQALDMITF